MTTPQIRAMLDDAKKSLAQRGLSANPELAAMVVELERKYDELLASEARIALTQAHLIFLRAAQP